MYRFCAAGWLVVILALVTGCGDNEPLKDLSGNWNGNITDMGGNPLAQATFVVTSGGDIPGGFVQTPDEQFNITAGGHFFPHHIKFNLQGGGGFASTSVNMNQNGSITGSGLYAPPGGGLDQEVLYTFLNQPIVP